MKLKIIVFILSFLVLGVLAGDADQICDGCWDPKLNFDIEGLGFMSSMIFISGQSYALSEANRKLRLEGRDSYFCGPENISSRILINILNAKLSGIVTSKQVTETVSEGLVKKYPCTTA